MVAIDNDDHLFYKIIYVIFLIFMIWCISNISLLLTTLLPL